MVAKEDVHFFQKGRQLFGGEVVNFQLSSGFLFWTKGMGIPSTKCSVDLLDKCRHTVFRSMAELGQKITKNPRRETHKNIDKKNLTGKHEPTFLNNPSIISKLGLQLFNFWWSLPFPNFQHASWMNQPTKALSIQITHALAVDCPTTTGNLGRHCLIKDIYYTIIQPAISSQSSLGK